MRRKITYAAFALMLAALIGISGMTAGARLEAWRAQEQQAFVAAQSTSIAVLSMDIGSEYQGERVVFAEEIIAALPATYTLVSKEVGDKGLSEGTYGALIIFPADFSLCLTTINSQRPLAAQFSYKLNMNLPEDGLLVVMTDILELEREVNDRLSYMFVSSVFEEFHDAQKRVSVVLANDEDDLKALSEVQSTDLVAKLLLTTLPQEIPEFRAADISEFSSDNQTIISDLDESYQEYLQLAVDDADALSVEADSTVNDEETGLAAFSSAINELTWLPDVGGKGDSFTQIGEGTSAAIAEISDALIDPVMDVSELLVEMEQSELDSDAYETIREQTIRAMLADQQETIIAGAEPQAIDNPEPPPMTDPVPPSGLTSPTGVSTYNPLDDPAVLAALGTLELASPTDVAVIRDALQRVNDNAYARGMYDGLTQGQTEGLAQGLYDGLLQGQAEGRAQGEYDGRADTNEHFLYQFATATDQFDADTFYDDFDKTGMMEEFQALKGQYATNTDIFKDSFSDRVDDFNAEVAEGYEGFRTALAELEVILEELFEAERAAMEAYGVEQISSLDSEFTEKKGLIQEIVDKIAAFDPLHHITDNHDVFAEYSSRFRDNVSGIQTEVSEQVTHDNEQLNNLYQDNAAYIAALKEDIQKTKDEGDELLATALQAFYDAKIGTSASNIENMQSFAMKLPNSRLGNLGNNNLYNFIASPIRGIDADPLAKPVMPARVRQIEFLHGDMILYAIAGVALLILLGIAAFFTASAVQDMRARRRYESELPIPDEPIPEI